MRRASLAILATLTGCAPRSQPPLQPSLIQSWREQAVQSHPRGMLWKPNFADEHLPAFPFAPLLVRLDASDTTDPHDLRIYFTQSRCTLDKVDYEQWTFFWPIEGAHAVGSWSGVRLTLDSEATPVIWEVFDTRAQGMRIYVSAGLEAAVAGQREADGVHGEKGIWFATQQPDAARHGAAVVRALADGPLPMGPIVYLDAEASVVTVLCRCMASQVDDITQTATYQLRDGAEWRNRDPACLDLPIADGTCPPYLCAATRPDWLRLVMRLPETF